MRHLRYKVLFLGLLVALCLCIVLVKRGPVRPEPASETELPSGTQLRVRWHQDAVLQADGSLIPHWFGSEQKIGLCLAVPISVDTSQWQMGFRFSGAPKGEMTYREPEFQAGTTLCFGQPPPEGLSSSRDLEVCGTIHDGLRERTHRVPCFQAVYDKDATEFKARRAAMERLFAKHDEIPTEQLIEEHEAYAAVLDAEGYPFQALNVRLVILHLLRDEGTPEALAEISRRLDQLPAWLEETEATVQQVTVMYQRALLELDHGRRRGAWMFLEDAADLAQSAAVSLHIFIVARQAEIIASAGGSQESIHRLRDVLEICDRWVCQDRLVLATHDDLAWRLVIDPDAGPPDLEQATKSLEIAATGEAQEDLRETANRRINRALLAIRQGRDPANFLAEARTILDQPLGGSRRRYLRAWVDVVEGLAALETDAPRWALELCHGPATQNSFPFVAAWAWSCLGQAHRQEGDLANAGIAFEQALVRHTLAAPDLGQDLPISPGRRVDDYYRAARVAVERQDAAGAWQILETLDHLAIDVTTACEDESTAVREQLAARRRELLEALSRTEPPFAPARERQLEPVRRSLMESLEELQRTMLSDCHQPLKKTPTPADLRAFALPDEVILLARDEEEQVSLVRRSPLPRNEVRTLVARLAAAQGSGTLDDQVWRELVQPLAAALAPPHPESLGRVTRFALHGVLQRVPLSALPMRVGEETPWLGALTTLVLQPAFVEEAGEFSNEESANVPLFVVDPHRNLPSGDLARETYRKRFPTARILFGSEATLSAVQQALSEASFLHIDAHGHFESAFPSLSGLGLYDRSMTVTDFALSPVPRSFVNLSGCNTGSLTQTGDSGRYGLAGAVARRGVRWVVANRGAVEDSLAQEFNEVFYREIAAGHEVPQAFRVAMASLRAQYPAAAWSNLLLVGSGAGGESNPSRTTSR